MPKVTQQQIKTALRENVAEPLRKAQEQRKRSKSQARRILSGIEDTWSITLFPDPKTGEVMIEVVTHSDSEAARAIHALLELSYGFVRHAFKRAFPKGRAIVVGKDGTEVRPKLAELLIIAQNRHREARNLPAVM